VIVLKLNIIGCTGIVESPDDFIQKSSDFISRVDLLLQFMDADLVLGKEHILTAVAHAQRAFERKNNISSSLAMEILIYCAGTPQIKAALERIGIKKGSKRIALIYQEGLDIEALLGKLDLKRDDSVLQVTESKLRDFGISESERGAVDKKKIKDLVLERVAMVDVIK
jgi:KEOPS complex subunit Cgi121